MATVLRDTIDKLHRELGRAFHVVGQPDHPMLLSGPDILVGGEGKLTAVVWIRKHETANSLAARITATRLALPPETRLMAVRAEGAEELERLLDHFDEVADARRPWEAIGRYAIGDARLRADRGALNKVKRRHAEKCAFALLLATLRRRRDLETVSPDAVLRDLAQANQENPSYSKKSLRLRRPLAQVEGSVVASLSPRGRPVQKLRNLCDAGFNLSYQLDTGIPYEKPDTNLNVLLVEDWPMFRYDPEKPIRSAAFGCWIMAKSSGAADIGHLIERSRDQKFFRSWQNA